MSTTNIKTLDERLRGRARKDLEKQVNAAANGLMNILDGNGANVPKILASSGSPMTAFVVMEHLKQAIIERMLPFREEKEIAGFLAKIDSLEADLKQTMEELADN